MGLEARLRAHIVNFADDFVICCRGTADVAMTAMQALMERLKLTINEEKTHRCRIPEEHFDFLGYTYGRCYSPRTGRAYIGVRPSTKSIRTVCRATSERTSRRWLLKDPDERVDGLIRLLRGWANYFSLGTVNPAYRVVDRHVKYRLRKWLCWKHKGSGRGFTRFPDEHLYSVMGLENLSVRPHSVL